MAEARETLKELARIIARISFKRHYQELMETGRNRWLSLDPHADWEKHDAEWAARDAAEEAKQAASAKRKSKPARTGTAPKLRRLSIHDLNCLLPGRS